jgi:hypothetical protein
MLIRTTDASVSVRAAAEGRKCWAICRISNKSAEYDRHIPLACQQETVHTRKVSGEFAGQRMVSGPGERVLAERLRRYVKAELKRADVSYAELARRLTEQGLLETESSITSKLNRGTFAATFFLATMKAIGHERIDLASL